MKMQITKQITTETAHRIWNHPGACQNIHGHSYKFEVTIESDVDPITGMVCDFKFLKILMKGIFGRWDHAIILDRNDPIVPIIETTNTRLLIVDYMPTAENMASAIAKGMADCYKDSDITLISVKVWETATSYAEWKSSGIGCCRAKS